MFLAALAGCGVETSDTWGGRPNIQVASIVLEAMESPAEPRPVAAPGHAYLINLWASWCDPCRRELASLERMAQASEGLRIRVVGINVDEDGNLAREFLRANPLSFPQYRDPGMRVTAKVWKAVGVPTTIVIDEEGRMLERISGARDWNMQEVRRVISSAVDEQSRHR